MPRTKIMSKGKNNFWSEESASCVEHYERQVKVKMDQMNSTCDMLSMSFVNQINECVSRLPHQIRKMSLIQLQQLKFEDDSDEGFKDVSSPSAEEMSKPRVPSSAVKRKKIVKNVSRANNVTLEGRRTRSNSRSQLRVEMIKPQTPKRRGKSTTRSSKKIKIEVTPNSSRTKNQFNLVTPKFKPNTPINMMRRPRQGEMILSMQGSPILVSGVSQDETANINVPLANGDMVSLLPNEGLRLSHVPYMDDESLRQLKILKGHIEKVIGNN